MGDLLLGNYKIDWVDNFVFKLALTEGTVGDGFMREISHGYASIYYFKLSFFYP